MPRSSRRQRSSASAPVARKRVRDPDTKMVYVLVPADVYDRSKALIEEDAFTIEEVYSFQDEVAAREGWNDPAMDAYDELDPRTSK